MIYEKFTKIAIKILLMATCICRDSFDRKTLSVFLYCESRHSERKGNVSDLIDIVEKLNNVSFRQIMKIMGEGSVKVLYKFPKATYNLFIRSNIPCVRRNSSLIIEGKLVEKRGRKATGLKTEKRYGSGVTNSEFLRIAPV